MGITTWGRCPVPKRPSGSAVILFRIKQQAAADFELRATRYDIKGASRHILFTEPKQSCRIGPVLRALLQPLVVEAV